MPVTSPDVIALTDAEREALGGAGMGTWAVSGQVDSVPDAQYSDAAVVGVLEVE
jgi:hypothetical protein